jgi:hypothetical protein
MNFRKGRSSTAEVEPNQKRERAGIEGAELNELIGIGGQRKSNKENEGLNNEKLLVS